MTDETHSNARNLRASDSSLPSEAPVVLVVDEPAVADLYAAYLDTTYAVRVAYGGEETFEVLDGDVDIVLLDSRMPDRRGDVVLERIRERGFDCRVTIVTAMTPEFDIIEMRLDEYLVKPVSHDELHDAVDRLVAQSAYTDRRREYCQLVSKRATLETHRNAAELEASVEFDQLDERIAALQADLSSTEAVFDPDDSAAASREFEV